MAGGPRKNRTRNNDERKQDIPLAQHSGEDPGAGAETPETSPPPASLQVAPGAGAPFSHPLRPSEIPTEDFDELQGLLNREASPEELGRWLDEHATVKLRRGGKS